MFFKKLFEFFLDISGELEVLEVARREAPEVVGVVIPNSSRFPAAVEIIIMSTKRVIMGKEETLMEMDSSQKTLTLFVSSKSWQT